MSSFHGIKGVGGPAVHERLPQDEYGQEGKRIRTKPNGIGQDHYQPALGRSESVKRKISGQGYGSARIGPDDRSHQLQSPSEQMYGRGHRRDTTTIITTITTTKNNTRNLEKNNHHHHHNKGSSVKGPVRWKRPIMNGFLQQQQQDQSLERAESAFSTGWPTFRNRIPNGSVEPDRDEAQESVNQYPHNQSLINGNGGEPMTLRELLDNPEKRIEALRRSRSSQASEQPQQQQQQQRGLNGTPQDHGRTFQPTTHTSSNRVPQTQERPTMNGLSRAPNTSFGHPRTDVSTRPTFSFQQNNTTGSNINSSPGDYKLQLPTERQRRDLYHSSSYSPSEYSQDDPEEEEGEHDQDTVEFTQNTGISGRAVEPSETSQPFEAQGRSPIPPRGTGTRNTQVQSQPPSQPQHQTQPRSNDARNGQDHRGDTKDDSFEACVAERRAKRRGEPLTAIPETNVAPTTTTPRDFPVRPAPASKLEHGRGLHLDDLLSPRHDRPPQEQRPKQQHPPQPPKSADTSTHNGGPLISGFPGADVPVQNNLTEHDHLFLEFSDGLGEGQTLKHVLGNLKGMIRELKRENRRLMKKNQQLEKKHEKQKKQLERSKKTNEKLSQRRDGRLDTGDAAANNARLTPQQVAAMKEEEESSHRIASQQQKLDEINRKSDAVKRMLEEVKKQLGESDPLFMMDADSDETDDDNEEEDESASSSDESDEGDNAEDMSEGLYRSDDSRGRTIQERFQTSPARASPSTHQRSAKFTSGSSSKAKGSQRSRALEDRVEDSHSPGRGRSKSTRKARSRSVTISPEYHRIVEKLGEVHIHNHLHYGGDTKTGSSSPALGSRQVMEDSRPVHRDHNIPTTEFSPDVYRSTLGSAPWPSQHTQSNPDLLNVPSSFSRGAHHAPSSPTQRPHPTDRHSNPTIVEPPPHSALRSSLQEAEQPPPSPAPPAPRVVDGPEVDASNDPKDHSPILVRASSGRSRGHVKFGDSQIHESTAAAISSALRNKKISIDLLRIKSMCKNHDPKRCIVCRSGNENGHQPAQSSSEGHSPKPADSNTGDKLSTARFTLSEVSTQPGSEPHPVRTRHHGTKSAEETASEDSSDEEEEEPGQSSGQDQDEESSESRLVDKRRSRASDQKKPSQPLPTEKTKSRRVEDGAHHNHNNDLTPEQQLHRAIAELTEDCQRVQKSYYQLSRKGKGKKVEENDDHPGAVADGKEGRRERLTVQQRQLQESADSLAEKMENAIRLKEQCLQERHRQEQEARTGRSGNVSGSGSLSREPRVKDNVPKDDGKKRHAPPVPNSNGSHNGKNVRENDTDEPERGTSSTKRTEGPNPAAARDGQDNTQTAPRSKDHQKEQRSLQRGKGGKVGTGGDGSNHERNENKHEEDKRSDGDRDRHTKKDAAVDQEQVPVRSKLKEPEGYRHRLTSEIRLPKLR
ncbi:hypothetical protein BGX31_004944 [Mortierella sp. GBA43]|nr:hypothetical protein BGX31_004944 [Mortierella sp. GBA43]